MTWPLALALAGFALALPPALLFFTNLRWYRVPPLPGRSGGAGAVGDDGPGDPVALREPGGPGPVLPAVSVLIPARNEGSAIGDCVRAALASRGVALEVVVLDDDSEDDTRHVVEQIARADARVRVEPAPPLPPGWCGKQHACHVLARLARHPLLAFVDADVRLAPAGLARAVAFKRASGAALVSGVPRQVTGTLGERLLIPLIHFLLLAYLPIARMRRSTRPAYGAGCGQLFVTDGDAYRAAGGHAAIRSSLHDGLQLPRAYRRAGLATDLFDATPAATCRMYRSGGEVWAGLTKNATEGMATPRAIVPWTVLLLGGQVLPPAVLLALPWAAGAGRPAAATAWAALLSAVAVAAAYAVRFAAVARFRQSLVGALLHPLGVSLLVAIQWTALLRRAFGRPPSWRGRTYGSGATDPAAAAEAIDMSGAPGARAARTPGSGGTGRA